jgi:acyl-coenzyme A thioesterase PaaI-like protein
MPQQAADFGIDDAKRVLGEVFAPWVLDLDLSVEAFDFTPSPDSGADWQPGAILRMPFSERLCRNGGTVCGQALMAFADTSIVPPNLAPTKSYSPMTTAHHPTHYIPPVTTSDVLADARVVRLGRTMSFGRVTLLSATDNRPVAMVSSAFAMLPS